MTDVELVIFLVPVVKDKIRLVASSSPTPSGMQGPIASTE